MYGEAIQVQQKVKELMAKCGIAAGGGAPTVRGLFMPVNVVVY